MSDADGKVTLQENLFRLKRITEDGVLIGSTKCINRNKWEHGEIRVFTSSSTSFAK
jgi:hypothetical protein